MKAGVFFGGGAFIALHAGYSKGPLARVKFDRVYGVSAGSLWAAILAFMGAEKGIEVLGTLQKTSDVFVTKDILAQAGDLIGRRWAGLFLGYGPLKALIKKHIIGKPTMPVTVSMVNLESGRHVHVTAYPDGTFASDDNQKFMAHTLDDFHNAVLSSCLTYPLVDAFLDKVNNGWVDGGFREGGPVEAAVQDRATEIHICLTGAYSEDMDFSGNGNDPLNGTTRLLEICANQNVISSVDAGINLALLKPTNQVLIYQAVGQGSPNDFNQKDIQANIRIGAVAKPVLAKDVKVID